MRSEREHAWPPPSRPFNHRSTGALSLFLSVVAREKKQKEGEKNGRKKRHMTTTKNPLLEFYAFCEDVPVVSNPDVKPLAVKPGIT
uniref:Uncharacterized protein n=1 Tax=Oryza nivara TaxID=4536 RepID=A0A0E0J1V7_ORYNI